MKTYYDNITKFSITTENGKIRCIQKKPIFNYDELFIHDINYEKYGMMGTAFHSGKLIPMMVKFKDGDPNLVCLDEIKISLLQHYSVCDKEINQTDFIEKNLYSFFTSEIDLMPILGYVVYKEKLKEPVFSWYEQENKIKDKTTLVEVDTNLPGDNLGQLAQLLVTDVPVYNKVYKSALVTNFYDRTLSLNKLDHDNPTIFMKVDSFNRYFSKIHHVLRDLAFYSPVKIELDDKQKLEFGYSEINVLIGSEYTMAINHVLGFINFFDNRKRDFLYSYDCPSTIVAGYDRIVK